MTFLKMLADGTLIAEVKKNSRESYRIICRDYKGHQLVDLRIWYDAPDSREMQPGKGVSIKVADVPQIVEARLASVR